MQYQDTARFTPISFVRDKALALTLALVTIAFVTSLLVILGTTTDAILLIDLTLVAVLFLAFALEYRRRARFWKSIEEALESLDKTRYFDELVCEPTFLEGKIALDMARSIAEQATHEGNELRMQSHDRAQYTELWVHEVKTPLAAARLLLDKMHGEDASKLKLELERVEHLVEQALFTARSDTLVNDYVIREIVLGDAVGEACKANMRYLTSCGVAIDIHIDPQSTVVADKAWLAFILTQLIINAAKYDATTIIFEAYENDKEGPHACTVLEVRDDGCGIPRRRRSPRLRPRIYGRGRSRPRLGNRHGALPRRSHVRADGARHHARERRGRGHARAAQLSPRSPPHARIAVTSDASWFSRRSIRPSAAPIAEATKTRGGLARTV